MIMERGARPDAVPKPKRGKTVFAVVLLGVGLALGLGLGVGAGATLRDLRDGAAKEYPRLRAPLSAMSAQEARDRWVACSVSDDAPGPEELEAMLARRQGRYAEPHWFTP